MPGPWEKYQQESDANAGPWQKYQQPAGAAPPQHWSESLGLNKTPWLSPPVDFAEGVLSGAASTVFNGGDLIRRAIGMKRVIDNPEVKQAMTAPDSIPGQAGKFVEQGAEFAIPGSVAAKAGKVAKLGVLARAGIEGATAAGVAATQTGGNPAATATAGVLGAAGPAVGAGVEALGKSGAAQKLYQSALKPSWSMVKKEGLDMLDTGLKEQIPISAKGLEMVGNKIDDIRKEISSGIQMHAGAGRTVDTAKVLSSLDDLEKFYRNTAAPQEALDTLQGIRDQFQKYHGQQIPVDVAQQIKINTYQELKKSYGQMATAKIEGLKQVARGLKEQISVVFPEIAGLNEQQSKLLGLDDALYRAVWRIDNHQIMGIGSPLAASAGHAVMGGPGAVAGLVGKFVLDDPGIKSRLAIALSKAGSVAPSAEVNKGMLLLRSGLEDAVSSNARSSQTFQPATVPAQ